VLAEEYADPDTFLRVYLAAGPIVSDPDAAVGGNAQAKGPNQIRRRLGTDPPSYHRPPNSVRARSPGISLLLDISR